MTNEEAIKKLEWALKNNTIYDENEALEYILAVKKGIEALEQEPKILDTLDFAIDASNGDTNYFVGFRNGLRYSKSLIDGKEPQFESCAEQEPKTDVLDKIRAEIKEVQTYKMFEGEDTVYVERKDVLAIIDKYKTKSEE